MHYVEKCLDLQEACKGAGAVPAVLTDIYPIGHDIFSQRHVGIKRERTAAVPAPGVAGSLAVKASVIAVDKSELRRALVYQGSRGSTEISSLAATGGIDLVLRLTVDWPESQTFTADLMRRFTLKDMQALDDRVAAHQKNNPLLTPPYDFGLSVQMMDGAVDVANNLAAYNSHTAQLAQVGVENPPFDVLTCFQGSPSSTFAMRISEPQLAALTGWVFTAPASPSA